MTIPKRRDFFLIGCPPASWRAICALLHTLNLQATRCFTTILDGLGKDWEEMWEGVSRKWGRNLPWCDSIRFSCRMSILFDPRVQCSGDERRRWAYSLIVMIPLMLSLERANWAE